MGPSQVVRPFLCSEFRASVMLLTSPTRNLSSSIYSCIRSTCSSAEELTNVLLEQLLPAMNKGSLFSFLSSTVMCFTLKFANYEQTLEIKKRALNGMQMYLLLWKDTIHSLIQLFKGRERAS